MEAIQFLKVFINQCIVPIAAVYILFKKNKKPLVFSAEFLCLYAISVAYCTIFARLLTKVVLLAAGYYTLEYSSVYTCYILLASLLMPIAIDAGKRAFRAMLMDEKDGKV